MAGAVADIHDSATLRAIKLSVMATRCEWLCVSTAPPGNTTHSQRFEALGLELPPAPVGRADYFFFLRFGRKTLNKNRAPAITTRDTMASAVMPSHFASVHATSPNVSTKLSQDEK